MTFFFISIFIFLVFWRPQEWLAPALYGWPLLDVLVGAAVLAFLVEMSENRIRKPDITVPVLLLGLFFATIMSHVAHTYYVGMMSTISAAWKICFFTALLFCVLDRPSRLRSLAIIFVAMACVMAVHALMQQRLGYGFAGYGPIWHMRPGMDEQVSRSLFFGIFGDPNDLAQILATSIPFAFVVTRRVSPFSLLVSVSVTVLLVLAILATRSRGGIVALVTVAVVMCLLIMPARWLPVLSAILLASALALVTLVGPYLDESAHDRVVFWGQANWVFKQNPLFGVGYGMFGEYVDMSRAAHNAFVLCYTELGVFGYWFWFCLLQMGIVGCWRTRIALKRSAGVDQAYMRRFAGLAVAAMFGFLASAYFLTRAYVYPLFVLFAALNAAPLIAQRMLPEDHPPLIRLRRDILIYGTLGAVASIVYIYFSILLLNRVFYG